MHNHRDWYLTIIRYKWGDIENSKAMSRAHLFLLHKSFTLQLHFELEYKACSAAGSNEVQAMNTKDSTLLLAHSISNTLDPASSQNIATANGSPSRHRPAWSNASDPAQTRSAGSSMQQWNEKAAHSACEDLNSTELRKNIWLDLAGKQMVIPINPPKSHS